MLSRIPKKVLWAAAVIVLIIIILGSIYFITKDNKGNKTNCDDVLYEPLKDYILMDNFQQFEGSYSNVWVGKGLFMTYKCSYFTMRPDGLALEGYYEKSSTSDASHKHNAIEQFVQEPNGVIYIYPLKDVKTVVGRIYPLFSNDSVLGNVFCDENDGNPEWRSVISVNVTEIKDKYTKGLVTNMIKEFQELEEKVGLHLGEGERYQSTCHETPVWPNDEGVVKRVT